MTYQIYAQENTPAVVVRIEPGFHIRNDVQQLGETAIDVLDEQHDPVFLIMDVRNLSIDLDDFIFGSNMIARQIGLFRHPNIREVLIVTGSRIVALGVQGLQSPVFGGIKLHIFNCFDDAVAYTRAIT